jgi:hypothetical protein
MIRTRAWPSAGPWRWWLVVGWMLAAGPAAGQALRQFDFTKDSQGWQPAHDVTRMQATPEGLLIEISGDDPYLHGPPRDYSADQPLTLHATLIGGRGPSIVPAVQQYVALHGLPPQRREPEIALGTAERPYWRTHKWTIKFGSIPVTWIDRMVPRRWRHIRIRRRIMEQVEYLVTRNVGDLQWSMQENLKQSVQSFRDTLGAGLQEAIQATRRALDAARCRRTENSARAAPEIARLESAAAELGALRSALCHNDD